MEEQWRRFWQELACPPEEEYDDLRRRLGITGQWVWLIRLRGVATTPPTASSATAVYYLECAEPDTVVSRFAASTEAYDLRFKAKLTDFHGSGVERLVLGYSPNLIFTLGRV